jgi:hypothetical protein
MQKQVGPATHRLAQGAVTAMHQPRRVGNRPPHPSHGPTEDPILTELGMGVHGHNRGHQIAPQLSEKEPNTKIDGGYSISAYHIANSRQYPPLPNLQNRRWHVRFSSRRTCSTWYTSKTVMGVDSGSWIGGTGAHPHVTPSFCACLFGPYTSRTVVPLNFTPNARSAGVRIQLTGFFSVL